MADIVSAEHEGSATTEEDLRLSFEDLGGRSIFCCLHLPVRRRRRTLVVICNPLGHEYERGHRALRQLAARLAFSGFPALRFDYSATGDSTGDENTVGPESWREDIDKAIAFGLDATGMRSVSLLGMRLGALLAAATSSRHANCRTLMLWRPVVSGARMLAEWDALQADYERGFGRDNEGEEYDSVLGWRLPRTWREQIAALVMPTLTDFAGNVLMLAGADQDAAMNAGEARFTVEADPSGPVWMQDPMNALVPAATLARIVAWYEELPDA